VERWEEFDESRRQEHQKQLDFRVGPSGVFDEGGQMMITGVGNFLVVYERFR
jgi:hypothetical protein